MLSTNEVRTRAAGFARAWKDASYEKGETQSFYNDFFEVFGVNRRRVAVFEEPVRRLGDRRGYIDLFWKGMLLVEQKSAGRSLAKAREQAFDYFPNLKPEELPRYLLLSDFQSFELIDLETRQETRFALADLPKHVEAFDFIRGREKRVFKDQDPVNIAAAEMMGRLHDALEAVNYTGHDLEQFLVRLVFCLFADDTGIFDPRDIFLDLIENRTKPDGSDLGLWIAQLFETLDTPEERRQTNLDEDLSRFPYVNGELFRERLRMPQFDAKMRKLLIEACGFRWDAISPAIFGSLFQSVMDKAERRKKGAHYTTEKNILKVVQPLFLDALNAEFAEIAKRKGADRERRLKAFHEKIAGLTFLDPACGCGNFLIITYRELRRLEIRLLKELHPDGQRVLDVKALSKLDVDQFFGIEFEEFPARIAETALWMMDHICNNELSQAFGENFARIPLKKSPSIRHGDALEIDWNEVLPAERCSYVLGNPPFIGAKYQSDAQRAQVREIAKLGGSGGTLDFVAAWFIKAGAYVKGGDASIGFVATNSLTQGEQVAQLWPILFGRCGLEIAFAHRTFAWGSDARGKAHVHVVILGLSQRRMEPLEKRLFSYDDINGEPTESRHRALSPYLIDASGLRDRHVVIAEVSASMFGAPKLMTGTQPIDGGHLIFDADEADEFLSLEPAAAAFMRPFPGAEEYLNGLERFVLYLATASPSDLKRMPLVVQRLREVSKFRRKSERKSTLAIADIPTKFNVEVVPKDPFLVLPEVSSERRKYLPIAWMEPPTIPSNKLRLLLNTDRWSFAILVSAIHMAWTKIVGGRLKSDYQYSVGINYNTFPWPEASAEQKAKIEALAQAVLDARAAHQGATLADLYDPDTMPANLRKAHTALDKAVDALYRRGGFASDRERVEHLFALYEKAAAPLTSGARKGKRR
jgi:hypothetical protein